MTITPNEKESASFFLFLSGLVIFVGGSLPLIAPFVRGDYWLIFICLPFALIAWWIGRVLVRSYLNSVYSTTEVDFGDDKLRVRNTPFGMTFEIAYSDVRSCQVTDIGSPKLCLEILVSDKHHKAYQVCTFRFLSGPIESLFNELKSRVGNAGDK